MLDTILKMYRGGMGSFQDYVLQDANGVLPQHDAFDRLRSRLHDGQGRVEVSDVL
ncbi:DUF6966 domain-containing protein [Micromonospora sp. GCM10011542]|uniref:DUF6966 domain-containing protein n=1 Tax=Micromonospora sp. GCM10011542 TaxID=3317337 RepID=UPI003619ED7B